MIQTDKRTCFSALVVSASLAALFCLSSSSALLCARTCSSVCKPILGWDTATLAKCTSPWKKGQGVGVVRGETNLEGQLVPCAYYGTLKSCNRNGAIVKFSTPHLLIAASLVVVLIAARSLGVLGEPVLLVPVARAPIVSVVTLPLSVCSL